MIRICRRATLPVLLVLSLMVGGCRGVGEPRDSSPRQLIIKFRPDTIACDPSGIARFSSISKVSLEFVRSMSGGACVVKQRAGSRSELRKEQRTLEADPAVEYVEPDAVMDAL